PLLDDPDARLRYEAARALGAAASAELVATILDRLDDRDPVDRHALLVALAAALPRLEAADELPRPLARRALGRLLALSGAAGRALAGRALARRVARRPSGAGQPLARAMERAGPEASLVLARTIGELDHPAARSALRERMSDEVVSLVTVVASVLGERGTGEDGALLLARAPELPWPASAA